MRILFCFLVGCAAAFGGYGQIGTGEFLVKSLSYSEDTTVDTPVVTEKCFVRSGQSVNNAQVILYQEALTDGANITVHAI